MKFAPILVILLLAFFLYTGVRHLQYSKTATDDSTPSKKYLLATGGVHIALAVLVLLVSVSTYRRYGDLDEFFHTVNQCVKDNY